jgi:hypothetical protein
MKRMRYGVAIAGLAATALIAAAALGAFSSGERVGSGARAEAPRGQAESIKVHGRWTIEVRAEDGSVVSRREFENAFTNGPYLAKILAKNLAVGGWAVALGSSSNATNPCFAGNTTTFTDACVVFDKRDTTTGPFANWQKTLDVSTDSFGTLVLKGSAIVQRDGSINTVGTSLGTCADTVTPAACTAPSSREGFTSKTLTSPVSVLEGQQVLATVNISFS